MCAQPTIARFLTFCLAVAPGLGHRVADCMYVDHQRPREIHDSWNAASPGVVEQLLELFFITVFPQALKANGQAMDHRKPGDFVLQNGQHSDLALGQQRLRFHEDRRSHDWRRCGSCAPGPPATIDRPLSWRT